MKNNKSWFTKNKKWVFPASGCLTIIVLGFIFAGVMISQLTSHFKTTVPYTEAMRIVQNDAKAIEILGEPIVNEDNIDGAFKYENGIGSADFEIPIEGSKSEGILYVSAKKENGNWTYSLMQVEIHDSEKVVNLLNEKNELLN